MIITEHLCPIINRLWGGVLDGQQKRPCPLLRPKRVWKRKNKCLMALVVDRIDFVPILLAAARSSWNCSSQKDRGLQRREFFSVTLDSSSLFDGATTSSKQLIVWQQQTKGLSDFLSTSTSSSSSGLLHSVVIIVHHTFPRGDLIRAECALLPSTCVFS